MIVLTLGIILLLVFYMLAITWCNGKLGRVRNKQLDCWVMEEIYSKYNVVSKNEM